MEINTFTEMNTISCQNNGLSSFEVTSKVFAMAAYKKKLAKELKQCHLLNSNPKMQVFHWKIDPSLWIEVIHPDEREQATSTCMMCERRL